MYVKDVLVQNQVGLHARPATFFIQKANEYKSSIWVEKEERRVNAKSLLGVLSLGLVGGTNIRIIADGGDEEPGCERLGGSGQFRLCGVNVLFVWSRFPERSRVQTAAFFVIWTVWPREEGRYGRRKKSEVGRIAA